MNSELVPAIWHALDRAGAEATSTSLSLPDTLRVNDWERIGEQLEVGRNANSWWMADWAAHGERCYRKEYPALLSKLYERETLQNLARVSRLVESSRRRDDLSFSIHVEVAALEPDEQSEWLADAFDHGWSVRELRERIAQWRGRGRGPALPSFTLRAQGELYDLCVGAATEARVEPADWVETGLRWLAANGSPHRRDQVEAAA